MAAVTVAHKMTSPSPNVYFKNFLKLLVDCYSANVNSAGNMLRVLHNTALFRLNYPVIVKKGLMKVKPRNNKRKGKKNWEREREGDRINSIGD